MTTQLKLALKVLARRRVFTAISLFGIALTLAVLMVATAIIDNIVAPQTPETRADRTLVVSRLTQWGEQETMTSPPGYGFVDQFVRTLPDIEKSSIFSTLQSTAIYRGGHRIDTMIRRTDGAYWQILDFDFVEGGPFSAEDDQSGRHVAVITEEMRRKLFDGRSAVGQTFELEGTQFRVVGVVPRVPFTRMMGYSQVWVPIGTLKSSDYRREMFGNFQGAVLVRDRGDMAAVKREFAARLPRVPLTNPKTMQTTNAGLDTTAEAFSRMILGDREGEASTAKLGFILALLAVVFMSLPALNLVTLNLSRILERGSEIGVRRAFGAPRRALIRQFVFENVVVTLIGGIIGFAVAAAMLPLLSSLAPVPDVVLSLNVRVFAWGMLLAIVFGILSGVYPAWRMSRLHPVNALRGGSR